MKHLKKLLLLPALFTIAMAVQAQTLVKGKVIDSENGESLMRSSVMIMTPDSSRMVTGGTTNDGGEFNIKNVKDGSYVVRVSYVGYHDFFRKIDVKSSENKGALTVGTVMMTPNSIELKQTVVTAQLKEVEVKEDTLIFNADAFKVPEGSVLEDLSRTIIFLKTPSCFSRVRFSSSSRSSAQSCR